jgi:arginine decarboxylase
VPTPSAQVSPHPSTSVRRPATPRTGPRIRLSSSQGTGPTRLAAFDAALMAAGVAGFNLVPLSSVVPMGATVEVVRPADQLQGRHGDLLYCVYAASYATTPGAHAWAGMAWGLRTDDSGAGLFVEHTGPTEASVQADLTATLGAMMASRPHRYEEGGRLLSSATFVDQPVAALVIASFQTASWAPLPDLEQAR